MFEILPNPSLETVLIGARAVLLIGAFWIFALAFIRWRRADERDNQRLHEQLNRTFNEVRSLHETIAVMSARLDALGERADVEAKLAPAGPVGAQRGYDLAARLAKNGSDIEDLMASCGITRHEAELLLRLNAAKPRTAEAKASNLPQQPTVQRHPARDSAPPPPANSRKRGSLLSVVG
jgi:hypothetical protein